jgi:four helix bundle protein
LPVWQGAPEFSERVSSLTDDRAFRSPGDLSDQLRRAALSISNNIAEGFEQGTTDGLLAYLYIARGSAGEARSVLHFCGRRSELSHLASEVSSLRSLAESCARQLRAWADSLQNSEIKGQRHLNDQARLSCEGRQTSDAVWRKLDEDQRRRVTRRLTTGRLETRRRLIEI